MINLNKEIYECNIINQHITYYILESKYNNQKKTNIINESINDKLNKAKEFIIRQVNKFLDVLSTIAGKVKKLFTETLPKAFKKIRDALGNLKITDNIKKTTIDIYAIGDDIQKIINIYDEYNDENFSKSISLNEDNDKIEKVRIAIDKINKGMGALKEYDVCDYSNTKLKISIKEIKKEFETRYKELTLQNTIAKEASLSKKKQEFENIKRQMQKNNNSEEEINKYVKLIQPMLEYHSANISFYNKFIRSANARIQTALEYFNKYLVGNNKEENNNEDAQIDPESLQVLKDAEEKCKKGNHVKAIILLKDNTLLLLGKDSKKAYAKINKLYNMLKKYNLLQEYDPGSSPISNDPKDYDETYYNKMAVAIVNNPCDERINNLIKAAKVVFGKKEKNK